MYKLSPVINWRKLTQNLFAKRLGDIHTFTCDRLTLSWKSNHPAVSTCINCHLWHGLCLTHCFIAKKFGEMYILSPMIDFLWLCYESGDRLKLHILRGMNMKILCLFVGGGNAIPYWLLQFSHSISFCMFIGPPSKENKDERKKKKREERLKLNMATCLWYHSTSSSQCRISRLLFPFGNLYLRLK
jgi:hypothetical protein